MILSVGEILTDMIGQDGVYKMYIGGAPFNAAVSVARAGVDCVFVGKVGKDVAGDFIKREIKKYGLIDHIITDEEHNTTLAFVSITAGERSFSFSRKGTADYRLKIEEIPQIERASIVNLGTLMLSEEEGRNFADELIEKVKGQGKLLSMDANFRNDLFESMEVRNRIMLPYLIRADILKMSKDELFEVTNESDLNTAVAKLGFKGILFVTDGERGSYAFADGESFFAPSKKVAPIDTTGAGDAFFGRVLAEIEKVLENNQKITDNLSDILEKGNESGAQAVLHLGAV